MASYPELVLRLNARNVDSYTVEPQIDRPNQPVNPDPDPGQATFDFDGLANVLHDVAGYGALLTKNLFEDPRVRTPFEQVRTEADLGKVPLRLRLFIDPDAPELHALRWETLRDPRDGTDLATGERILFSRYLRSPDWRSVQRRPRGDWRALVVVANPTNLNEYAPEGVPLQALDVSRELALAEEALG